MIGWFIKTYIHKPIKILQFLLRGKIQIMFDVTLKYFNIFSNKPPASWVAYITRNFLTYYPCWYYSSMIIGLLARIMIDSQLGGWQFVTRWLQKQPSEVFLGKGVLKLCSKFTGAHPCPSVISIKLLCNFIEITFRHGCSPVNLSHIFRTCFPKNIPTASSVG